MRESLLLLLPLLGRATALTPLRGLGNSHIVRGRLLGNSHTARARPIVLVYEDWLDSKARNPLSPESQEVLFKYGPVVYSARCFDSEEYNEVRIYQPAGVEAKNSLCPRPSHRVCSN
jgi:hypothetical protein